MHKIYWSYKGFAGDAFYGDIEDRTAKKFAPNSRSVSFRLFDWLTQKGHGPGYFNNSGVYIALRQSVFKTDADKQSALAIMFAAHNVVVFQDDVGFWDAVSESKLTEKRTRKERPY